MAKGAGLALGLGLCSLVAGLMYTGVLEKKDVQQADPSIAAALKAQDTLNETNLNMARSLYMQAQNTAPQSASDLVPQYLDHIPPEAFSKSATIVNQYSGQGGWVLNDQGFAPNSPQDLSSIATPPPTH